ncbi:CAP domain-containing protein [Demequina sp.]|uniref:CAP domain-containing protein n=1 Tax=Demequina sp. TaxID=2050685 RepID=UPI003A8B16C2
MALTGTAAAALLAGCAAQNSAAGTHTDATSGGLDAADERQQPQPDIPALQLSESPSEDPADGAADGSADGAADARIGASSEPDADTAEDQTDAGEGRKVKKDAAKSLDQRADALARQLFDLANQARDDDGDNELEWADCAERQAIDRAKVARSKDKLEHEELGFSCTATIVGENLVRGDGPAENLHQLWMDSEGHRENILRDEFTELGVGCVAHAVGDRTAPADDADDIGGWVCSQMFYGG